MGTRELLILILGLAVVAVILRGLYVALHARRSQIRLAIDKNIPQDLDLEELEMSELPNGGARIKKRSLDAVNQQNTLQNELDLGAEPEDDEAVPILLDTVEIKSQDEIPETEEEMFEEEAVEEEFFDDDTYDESAHDEETEQPTFEDPADSGIEDHVESEVADGIDDVLENVIEDELEAESDDSIRLDPELGQDESEDTMDDDFDDFSMTAGERIGGSDSSSTGVPGFRSRFGGAAGKDSSKSNRGNKESLFSKFSKKDTVSHVDENSNLEVESDPLFEGYEQTYQANEEELEPLESESLEDGSDVDDSLEPVEESGSNEVADINQARESRRPASNGQVSDNSNQPAVPSEVLVVNVMSREGEQFYGPDLLQVLITAGLKHGDMNIFHKHVDNDQENPAIFSVANILNPGTFDLDAIDEFSTRGVSLFLAMPSVISNRDAFEEMLRTAQQIRAALDGELRDDHRSVMTAQTIEHYRQRIHDYELRKLKAAQARS